MNISSATSFPLPGIYIQIALRGQYLEEISSVALPDQLVIVIYLIY